MAEAESLKNKEDFARRHHYLVSTAVIPGIYNSPYAVCVLSTCAENMSLVLDE